MITQTYHIESDIKVIMVNEIKYGIRMVVEIEETRHLFEAIIEVSPVQLEIVKWRQLHSLKSITESPFTKYYPIQPDSELEGLLEKVFRNKEKVANIEKQIPILIQMW